MGVPALFSNIVRNYSGVIKTLDSIQQKFDNLYLDSNSIVYDCVHGYTGDNIITDEQIIKEVCAKIHNYINIVKPTETVIIAFDGVAPVAKLENQRNRRYKSEFTTSMLKRAGIDKKSWDTTAITPGTPFMTKLDKGLKDYFLSNTTRKATTNSKQSSSNKKLGVKNIIVSSSMEAGEGEHKIFEYIRNNQEKHANEKTVVYGLDADLIMLSINHLRFCPQIYLYRETPHFIRSLNKNLDPGQLYILDIAELFSRLSQEMNGGKAPNTVSEKNRAFDYIFMMSLLGNDYIPHSPALNIRTKGTSIIMNTYQNVIASSNINLTTDDGNKINWKAFRKFVSALAELEEESMKEEHRLRDILENRGFMLRNGDGQNEHEVIQRMNAIPIYNREKEKYINPYEPYWEERYYKALFDVERFEMSQDICKSYLEALEWTMSYYTSGCVDWRWSYPYHYAPLYTDLARYIPVFDMQMIEKKETNPVLPLTQLSYVLPMSAHHMLPSRLRDDLYEKMGDKYSDNWEFEWAYCRYFWECHAKMIPFDIDQLEKRVLDIYGLGLTT
jgi:5'-3' exonuclease